MLGSAKSENVMLISCETAAAPPMPLLLLSVGKVVVIIINHY